MILFHAKANGQVTTTPSLVPQGSSMQDLVVLSEFDYALCTIRLEPATGVYIPDIICDFVETDNQKTLWVANMPPEATKLNGQVNYQLEFTAADGTTMPTLSGTFRVSKGVISNMPETVANLQSYTIGQIYTLLSNIYGKVVEMASDGGGTIYVDVRENGTSTLSGKTIVGHVKAGRNVIARYGGMNYSYFSDISEEVAVFRLTVSGGIRATVDAVETESIIIRGNNAVVSRELFEGKSSASGTFVIPPTEWTDSTPSSAQIILGVNVFTAGCVVLIIPEDDATKAAAEAARMSMVINQTGDFDAPTPDSVMIARAEGGTVPTIPLNFRYVVLKTGSTDKALVAMVGVDAVGAGGTGGTGGSGGNEGGTTSGVDEAAVRAIINQVVPAWARASTKPTYNKDEVGLGNVDNVKQYSSSNQPDYPVDSVNGKTGAVQLNADDVDARSSSWMPTAAQVGADPSGTAATKVSDHDTYTGAHNDIRLLIKGLSDRLNALANSDDTTLDDLKEIVTYIKANKALIDSITTSKVSVTDIIDNLTTNVSNRPLSAAQGVALKNLIDALGNSKLDASALGAAVNQALLIAKESGEFKGDKGDQGPGGKSPTVTVSKVGSATTITAVNADGTSSTAQVQDGITYAEVLYVDTPADLDGVEIDKTKVYVCKADGKQYAYKKFETVIESKDLVPSSTPSDTQLSYGWVEGEGYCANRRLSSDGTDKSSTPCRTTGYIEVTDDDVLTIKNYVCASGVVTYFIAYDENKTKMVERPAGGISGDAGEYIPSRYDFVTVSDDGTATFKKTLAETYGVTGIKYLRISWGNSTVIEVYRQPQANTVTEWTAIRDFLPTDRSEDIDKLQEDSNNYNVRLTKLEQGNGGSSSYADAIDKIRNYDKPLYDTLEPYLLSEDIDFDASKVTVYTSTQDPDGAKKKALVQRVYDDYDDLCTTHPEYVRDVTETFGGLCSDNEVYVRAYEFCERPGRVQTDDATRWSERKPTIIIVSGIHQEWNGVYSMLEALRCIVTDDALRWLRRNFRIVILPVCNPYSFYGADASGHYNANGIEIHNNFIVDFSNAGDATHGTEPLTEVETNYINNVMQTYRDDAVCLLSCHSNATKGANFIWGSVATKLMVNTVLRLVDMMSYAWDKKYDNYRNAIDTIKSQGSNPQDDGDYRCGFANMSTSFGTEAKQALYHGFQGLNVEVYERFYLFDPDGTDAALAVSRGAEVYVNLLRLLAVTYDNNDRDKYAPTPAYEFVD